MSYRRKRNQRAAAEHEFYESPSGNPEAWSEEGLTYPTNSLFPGPRETRILDSQNRATFTFDPGDISDRVDWAIGGVPGDTKIVGGMGVTSPYTVDAHNFQGMSQIVRRMPDTNYGPVVTSDHNSILQMLFAMQETAHFFPNEVSQADVIKAV